MKRTLFSAVLVLLLGLSAQNDSLASENLASDGQSQVQPQEEDMKTKKPPRLDIISKILEANKGVNHILVEGDVALSKKKNAMKCWSNYCKWSKSYNGLVEVPYTLSDYFYDSERALIEKAMEAFHKKTCVRFVPYQGQADYLSIESEIGCWSSIGRDGGQQVVSMSVYGCLDHGVIQHELLHALGFHHEHTRSDRDQYVRINWENIPEEHAFNFHKMDTNNLNTPYDYSSVMHYGRYEDVLDKSLKCPGELKDPEELGYNALRIYHCGLDFIFFLECDRKKCVKILKTNCRKLTVECFKCAGSNKRRTAFTSEFGADTITPIPDSSVPVGQRDDMSDIDILRINRLYECNI